VVGCGWNGVFADDVPSRVEKRPMTTAVFTQRKVVDEIRMPNRVSRDSLVGAPAIIVDSRHGPVVPVLEAYNRGVNLIGSR
jgi:hypothetical protein